MPTLTRPVADAAAAARQRRRGPASSSATIPGSCACSAVDPKTVPPITLEVARTWIARRRAHPNAWVVEHEGRFLGELRLDDVDRQARHARLAVGFYDAGKLGVAWGREAVRLALEHAFGRLAWSASRCRVLAYNETRDPLLRRLRLQGGAS
jgi:RimJ/RimL family protein N-acetyltransferase